MCPRTTAIARGQETGGGGDDLKPPTEMAWAMAATPAVVLAANFYDRGGEGEVSVIAVVAVTALLPCHCCGHHCQPYMLHQAWPHVIAEVVTTLGRCGRTRVVPAPPNRAIVTLLSLSLSRCCCCRGLPPRCRPHPTAVVVVAAPRVVVPVSIVVIIAHHPFPSPNLAEGLQRRKGVAQSLLIVVSQSTTEQENGG